MFKVGELIVYGNTGVCRVVSIGPLSIGGAQGQDYYTLEPFYSPKSRVFTPCNNQKIVMRPIMDPEAAKAVLDEFASIKLLEVTDEKKREETYKASLHTCDIRDLISILKTINLRKQMRLAQGKKATASDEKYYTMAHEKLCDELAVVLEVDRDKIKNVIHDKVEQAGA